MIELIDGLPGNVLAIKATGLVSGDDYRHVVTPAATAMRAAHDRLRLLFHIPPGFRKFTTTALWDDRQIGLYSLHNFDRVAVVTDIEWLKGLANGVRLSAPAEIRVFAHAELDAARDWVRA